ncbi:HK97 gp10 family phage protein [Clostridium sp. 'deep sea']|uniref:HK97-gp10 family putative phage morphogenesis protein n=1 Tax=Clostridium sp. 'deep sea' TaxID=2779445 RepID=UPI0018966163|nr:HK97-gp10 family putative phage morphogenesis protein [Clostridium sp. 'deep sea']QOR34441.1 HK97 gp10 family phage protein [Clostridium sp. 'deep sea']
MPTPKSVVKVKKNGVEYISNVNRAQYTIKELCRAALRDVAKFLRKRIKARAPKGKGNLNKNIGSWVRRSKDGIPHLQIGVYDRSRAKKKGLKYAFYAMFFEFGTSKMPARPFIKPTVLENIETIKTIQAQYLSAIEDEHKALQLINEKDEIADDG